MEKKYIKWHEFFKVQEDKIIHYKITPDRLVDNKTLTIAKAMHEMYSSPRDRVMMDLKGVNVTYKIKDKTYFDIIFKPHQANFYLSVHKKWSKFMEMKMQNVWERCAIEIVDRVEISDFDSSKCVACDVRLKNNNMFSLKTTTKDLDPLNSMFAILRDLKDEDNERVRISFVFDSENRLDWQTTADDNYKHYQKGHMPKRVQVSMADVFQYAFKGFEIGMLWYIDLKMMIIEGCLGFMGAGYSEERQKDIAVSKDINVLLKQAEGGLTKDTMSKLKSPTFSTHIRVLSQSDNKDNRIINMRTVSNAFKDLSGDNELQTTELSQKIMQRRIKQIMEFRQPFRVDKDVCSDEEIAKFIQVPQATLQEVYNLDCIDTRETNIPDELKQKGIEIGISLKQMKTTKTYWCNDYNSMALTKVIAGCPGSGKTTFAERFIIGANKQRHCTITFDYIKNCEMSEHTIPYTKNNVIIDLSNVNELPCFAYPEIKINESMEPFDKKVIASDIAGQIKYLINSIVDDETGYLTSQMTRYLTAAAKIVFIHNDGSLNKVLNVLEDWKVRNEYIRKSKGVYDNDDRIISTLKELNETEDGGKIIGTKGHLINGILTRMERLQENPYLEIMLKAETDKHNFTNYMNEGKAVYIKMPEKVFKDPMLKDTIVTYFLTRIRLASLQRAEINKPNICHIIIDEVHQIPTASSFFKNHIIEFRKFGLAPFFTIHYLKQFRSLLDAVKSSGVSYMFLAGLEKENIVSMKEELNPFTVDEVLNLKEFHSLNVIRYNNKYAKFITKLPPPIITK